MLPVTSMNALLASTPALTGFVPTDSLLLITTANEPDGTQTLGPFFRCDLSALTHNPEHLLQDIATRLAELPIAQAIGTIVCAAGDVQQTGTLPWQNLVARAITTFNEHGLTDLDFVHITEFTAETRWQSYLSPSRYGYMHDPGSTAAAAESAFRGLIIAPTREALVARLALRPEAERETLRPLIEAAHKDAITAIDDSAQARRRLDRADAGIHAALHGTMPTNHRDIADLIATWTVPEFRDALSADDETRVAVENLLLHLRREAPEPYASELAAIVAMHAFLRGDGVLARIALDTMEHKTKLAAVLAVALENWIHPAAARAVLAEAAHKSRAELLGEQTPIATKAEQHA